MNVTLVRSSLLFVVLLSCSASSQSHITTSVQSARAIWKGATSIVRIDVIGQSSLTFDVSGNERQECGHLVRAANPRVLSGARLDPVEFYSFEPLEVGAEHLVALVDSGEPLPDAAYRSMSEHDAAYIRCRSRIRLRVLGSARILPMEGDERVSVSSKLVFRELKDDSPGGTISLVDLIRFAAALGLRPDLEPIQ